MRHNFIKNYICVLIFKIKMTNIFMYINFVKIQKINFELNEK